MFDYEKIKEYDKYKTKVLKYIIYKKRTENEIRRKFVKGEVPFPDFWGGYIIKPTKIEFWQGGQDRLHDRFVYELQNDNSWTISRLAP